MATNKLELEALALNYVKYYDKEDALRDISRKAKEEVRDWVNDLSESELFDLMSEFDCEIHRIDEFDDVFRHMRPSEVLRELGDMDLDCDYFSSRTLDTGNEIWDVSQVDAYEVVDSLYTREIYWEDYKLIDIFEDEEYLTLRVKELFAQYELAKAVFDKAFMDDPQATIAALWNLHQN